VNATACEDLSLTSNDRCDRCSAAAKVIATFINGQLMFCGHHAKEQKALKNKALSIYDPDGFLNVS
jgi:hypothetical protein